MARTAKCPKCSGSMVEGWIRDSTYGSNVVSGWFAGKPERSIWTGVKLKGQQPAAITTYRCSSCGYLESYANF